jgi:diadenylate cyclase
MLDRLIGFITSLQIEPRAVVDVGLTAILIYGLFSLIRGTRAVRLVIGVTVLYAIYLVAQFFGLDLLSQILQTGAVVGLLALVVVFQPELRRALERIGRIGSLGWLLAPTSGGVVERVAGEVAQAASHLSARHQGALIVFERETGLEDAAEAGVMLHADLSAELLETIFMPRTALHDGAVIVRGDHILAAGAVLELSETAVQEERFGGTRHRAALSISEGTDAVVVVVSEETGAISLVERARFVRGLDEERLRAALIELLGPSNGRGRGPFFLPAPASLGRARRLVWPRRDRPSGPAHPSGDDARGGKAAAAVPGADRH